MMTTALNLDDAMDRVPLRGSLNPQPRVLVVDDEPMIRLLIARVLTARGYQVDVAEDGEAAWSILNSDFSYDLLVTDNNMPRMSGVELLKNLHAARLSIPVVLISAILPTEELHWHPWLKIDATLPKPFTVDDLVATVSNTLRLAEAEYHAVPAHA